MVLRVAGAEEDDSNVVVGRAGIILLSTDGQRWQRVPFPDAADLAAIRASDARTVTVMTTDGRAFRTTDSGQSWTPVQGF